MMRTCDGTDPNLLVDVGGLPCDCGLTFDDVELAVIWPHQALSPRLTEAERDALLALLSEPDTEESDHG
jgi:hypothetical protein